MEPQIAGQFFGADTRWSLDNLERLASSEDRWKGIKTPPPGILGPLWLFVDLRPHFLSHRGRVDDSGAIFCYGTWSPGSVPVWGVNIMKQEGVNFICGPQGRVAESSQEASESEGFIPVVLFSFSHCLAVFAISLQHRHFPSFPEIFSIKVVGSYYIYYTMTCNVDTDRWYVLIYCWRTLGPHEPSHFAQYPMPVWPIILLKIKRRYSIKGFQLWAVPISSILFACVLSAKKHP